MAVTIPPVLVLIVCKTVLAGPPDANASFTHWESRDWATQGSMMICRREEIQLYDQAEDQGATPLNPNFSEWSQCARAGITLAQQWDEQHRASPYRVWRVACPTPEFNEQGEIIG